MQNGDILHRILKPLIINFSLWITSENGVEIIYGSTFFPNLYFETDINKQIENHWHVNVRFIIFVHI